MGEVVRLVIREVRRVLMLVMMVLQVLVLVMMVLQVLMLVMMVLQVLMLMLVMMVLQVEEERKERVRMGWYLALSQGTILALIFLLIRRNNVLSN